MEALNNPSVQTKHITLLIIINAVISIVSVIACLYVMYTISLDHNKQRLKELAQSQARLIESVSDYDLKHLVDFDENRTANEAWQESLSQIKNAHQNYQGFGQTGEFTLARLENNQIVFLLSHRHFDLDNPKPVSLQSEFAQPMRAALQGNAGVMVGYDYRGAMVVAAYEPVSTHNGTLGIVAKIDLSEIQKPYLLTGVSILFIVILVMIGVSFMFFAYLKPIIKRHKSSIRALEKSQNLLSKSQEIAKISSWDYDFESAYLNCSNALYKIFDIDKQEDLNSLQDLFTYVHEEDVKRVKASLSQKNLKKFYNQRFRIVTPQNELKYIHAAGEVLVNKKSERKSLIGVIRDITEETLIENILHEQEEMMVAQSRQVAMGDMVAMIAHQWRQPLASVTMVVNNVLSQLHFDEKVDEKILEKDMHKISDQTKYLSSTIDDFRNFFNPSNTKSWVCLCEVLEDTLKIIGKSLENNNIKIEKNIKKSVQVEILDKEMLQVFLIVLNNAKDVLLQNSIKDATISLTIEGKEGGICFSCCDNGGGIPKEILPRLGEPYLTTKLKTGTGLGLYMSKIIIEKHMNGTLKWYNKLNGACVEIVIPFSHERKESHE